VVVLLLVGILLATAISRPVEALHRRLGLRRGEMREVDGELRRRCGPLGRLRGAWRRDSGQPTGKWRFAGSCWADRPHARDLMAPAQVMAGVRREGPLATRAGDYRHNGCRRDGQGGWLVRCVGP
jgi:hypothetical protein